MKLGDFLRRMAPEVGTGPGPMRGRISKVSVLPRGVRSVVIHFGIDEPGALDLKPGTLFEGRMVEPEPKRPSRGKAEAGPG